MAYQTSDILSIMEQESGVDIVNLRVDGGASMNEFLMQFQSDILNVDVIRPKCVESTALGAAYLAGMATGYWGSLEEIKNNWELSRVFKPEMEQAYRENLLKGWKKAVKCALAWAED
jgi:glycerol kinase